MLLQISQHHFGETLNFTMKCKLFAVAAVDETADQDLKGWGGGISASAKPRNTQQELPPLSALLLLNCCGSMDIPWRGSSSKQAHRDQMSFQENPQLSASCSESSQRCLLMPQHLLIQDLSQLNRKPLHSQLLETARERLKVHVPWLCKTEITVASTFGPWTAATLQQQLCHLPSTYHRGSANSSSVC